jgi:hypothetical protein
MFTVNSKSESKVKYVFESTNPPVSAKKLLSDNFSGTPGTIEVTLTLSKKDPPIPQELHDGLRNVVKDCADSHLRACYDDRYNSLMSYIGMMGVHGSSYRIHKVRLE